MTAPDPSLPPSHVPDAARSERAPSEHLNSDDARVLDLLVDAGFDRSLLAALPPEDAARAERLLAQCALMDAYPVDDEVLVGSGADADTLLDATMARIDRETSEQCERMKLDPERGVGVRRTIRFPDLIAVASIAILAALIVVPVLNWRNARALDLKCENNLRLVAAGLDAYTQSFNNALPMAASVLPDVSETLGSWLGYRNADNLKLLKEGHFCSSGCLCCPGDHDPAGCYAYQVAVGDRRPQWQLGPRQVVVGDRNPLVDLKRNGEVIASVAVNSASHGGRGQNMLFSDASVGFASSPYLEIASGVGPAVIDNIWLPFGDRSESLLQGSLGRPSDAGAGRGPAAPRVDTFLLH